VGNTRGWIAKSVDPNECDWWFGGREDFLSLASDIKMANFLIKAACREEDII
jgi:hypothetical protein